jgi:hypothetical protein
MVSLVRKAIKAKQERNRTKSALTPMEMQETQPNIQKQEQQRQPQCRHMDTYESSAGKCAACASEKKAARVYRWKIIFGLVAPFALQALDSTMYEQNPHFLYQQLTIFP